MPHADITATAAIDSIAASARELAKALKSLTEFVPGAEAKRVARVLEFETAELASAVTILRKAFGDERAADKPTPGPLPPIAGGTP